MSPSLVISQLIQRSVSIPACRVLEVRHSVPVPVRLEEGVLGADGCCFAIADDKGQGAHHGSELLAEEGLQRLVVGAGHSPIFQLHTPQRSGVCKKDRQRRAERGGPMVGLVDAMAELRASQERASPAKAARAAAERLATVCGNDHYFEDGHDDPIGQPVVTPLQGAPAPASRKDFLPTRRHASTAAQTRSTASLASGYCSVQVRLRAVSMALAARPVHPPPLAWASTKLRSGSSSTAYSDCASLDSAVFRCSTTRAGSTVGRGRSRLAITVMSSPAPAPQPPPRSGHWVAGLQNAAVPRHLVR